MFKNPLVSRGPVRVGDITCRGHQVVTVQGKESKYRVLCTFRNDAQPNNL